MLLLPRRAKVDSLHSIVNHKPCSPCTMNYEFSIPSATAFANIIVPYQEPEWIMPVSGKISQLFGKTSFSWHYAGGVHTGLDIAAPSGTPIYASRKGVVEFSGYKGGYGYLVILDHGNGLKSYYAHQSKILVKKGQSVEMGEQIGKIGNSGFSFGNHTHWEIRVNGVPKNPLSFI